MSTWRIFCWAMLHSPEYRLCYIRGPFRFRKERTIDGSTFWFGVCFEPIFIYVPYSVRCAYNRAQQLEQNPSAFDEFDDIPF